MQYVLPDCHPMTVCRKNKITIRKGECETNSKTVFISGDHRINYAGGRENEVSGGHINIRERQEEEHFRI